ncbi:hypothetical protein YDYSG_41350 [Paenibacillus tyrfis]|uniref:phage tail terminator family protein n=1 Tax=Paenibacillus tyrfis TaxID=1501230 RepID=UPI00249096CE|nr:hypothetical protein [Paenibacillus tyrfis]GLI08105.1 hypothetical protein YDYSG_41350 [Paenibacillus tyrfis]
MKLYPASIGVVNVEEIKQGIAKRLKELFPAASVYTEQVEQGFTKPAFFVRQTEGAQKHVMNRRYIRTGTFDIAYFPVPGSPQLIRDCEMVRDTLYERLELIPWEGHTYRSSGMRYTLADNVLHFYVSFEVHVMRPKEAVPTMRNLVQEEHIRHD